jgi:hypothetical protein
MAAAERQVEALWQALTPARDLSPEGAIAFRTGSAIQLLLLRALKEFADTEAAQQQRWLDYLLLGYVGGLVMLEDHLPGGQEAIRQSVRRVRKTFDEVRP